MAGEEETGWVGCGGVGIQPHPFAANLVLSVYSYASNSVYKKLFMVASKPDNYFSRGADVGVGSLNCLRQTNIAPRVITFSYIVVCSK